MYSVQYHITINRRTVTNQKKNTVEYTAIKTVKMSTEAKHGSPIHIHVLGLMPTYQWSTKYNFIQCLM